MPPCAPSPPSDWNQEQNYKSTSNIRRNRQRSTPGTEESLKISIVISPVTPWQQARTGRATSTHWVPVEILDVKVGSFARRAAFARSCDKRPISCLSERRWGEEDSHSGGPSPAFLDHHCPSPPPNGPPPRDTALQTIREARLLRGSSANVIFLVPTYRNTTATSERHNRPRKGDRRVTQSARMNIPAWG